MTQTCTHACTRGAVSAHMLASLPGYKAVDMHHADAAVPSRPWVVTLLPLRMGYESMFCTYTMCFEYFLSVVQGISISIWVGTYSLSFLPLLCDYPLLLIFIFYFLYSHRKHLFSPTDHRQPFPSTWISLYLGTYFCVGCDLGSLHLDSCEKYLGPCCLSRGTYYRGAMLTLVPTESFWFYLTNVVRAALS